MPDYKKLYHKMFNAITDTIEYLQKVQLESEEEYIKACEDKQKIIRIIDRQASKDKD
ncbi:MAG: hypothetical protein Q4A86_03260 [Clostridia bacterium]|nr:hypothetical protein [Clostridia bacterium]